MNLDVHNTQFCSEWDANPIELEIKVRRAERGGWSRHGVPYRQAYSYGPIGEGWYVQTLVRPINRALPSL